MNYMEQVAQVLGVKLEEEFMIAIKGHTSQRYRFKFTGSGLVYEEDNSSYWRLNEGCLTGIINGSYQIVKLPDQVLDDIEKEYLSAVIKPWRNRVVNILKVRTMDEEYLSISLEHDVVNLPYFKKGTMYKGMIPSQIYTLEELGL